MQDEDRLRERVELALDNRQIFLLFSASAVVLSLVFALGVVVGKRLSPVVAATPKADPLTMLDRAGAGAADDGLTFPQALTGAAKASPAPTEKATENAAGGAAEGAKPDVQAPSKGKKGVDAPAAPALPKPRPNKADAKQERLARAAKAKAAREAKIAAARAQAAAKAAAKAAQKAMKLALAQAKQSAKRAAKQAAKRAKLAAKRAKLEAKRAAKQAALSKAKAAKAAKMAKAKAAPEEGGYTLQLSSFQDRVEAERFMNTLRQKGHDPQMVPTRIPNRGLWYRVRLGSYPSWKQALAAKRSFETSTKLIAYVARR